MSASINGATIVAPLKLFYFKKSIPILLNQGESEPTKRGEQKNPNASGYKEDTDIKRIADALLKAVKKQGYYRR